MNHIDYYKSIILNNGVSSGGSGGITPTGTLEINIQENGVTTHDVTNYAEASVTVDVPEPSGTAELAYTMEKGVYTLDETADVSGKANAHVTVDASALEPVGTKEINITSNGSVTEDVKDYSSVHITTQVDAGGGEEMQELLNIIGGTFKETELTNGDITNLVGYNFYNNDDTKIYNLPNVKSVGPYTFASDEMIYPVVTEIHLPSAISIGESCFDGCTRLKVLEIPNVESINGPDTFSGCNSLKKLICPKLDSYNLQTFRNYRKPAISVLDILGSSSMKLDVSELTSLDYLVIRKEDGLCNLYSTTFASYIYVPDVLVESYKVATNWSTHADQIHPLSEYVEPEV